MWPLSRLESATFAISRQQSSASVQGATRAPPTASRERPLEVDKAERRTALAARKKTLEMMAYCRAPIQLTKKSGFAFYRKFVNPRITDYDEADPRIGRIERIGVLAIELPKTYSYFRNTAYRAYHDYYYIAVKCD